MMAQTIASPAFLSRLPRVRGDYQPGADLAAMTWFRVGGPADVLYRPADADDLAAFLAGCPADVPITVLGVGSNLLIRDGGVAGVVIRLPKTFAKIEIAGDCIDAGAAALDVTIAARAREAGLGGMEFLRGVPGSLGGAVAMNAGAYGREIADILDSAEILTRAGHRQWLSADDLGFGYRRAALPEGAIVIAARLRGQPADPAAIGAEMDRIAAEREASQPLRTRTGGSTFKNPPGAKAWALIDAAGCRGLARGGARISEKHCNFLLNTGDATAADLEALGEQVRERVKAQSGIDLEWEIRRIGRAGGAA
ncbi:MAG: UDP-N-acetylmuramate dehydrogenase [Sphingomonadales bacterium]